jgi:tetratricopeptide (TPR) repeat protein
MRSQPTTTRTNAALALAASLVAAGALATGASAQEAEEAVVGSPAAVAESPLASLRRGRDALIAARDFNAALNPAKTIVDSQSEEREPEYASDLAALGLIQGELRDTEPAIDNLLEAIEIVEGAEGTYSPTLIEYYRGLGRTYIKAAQYEEAIVTLEQAQHISQRHLGLFNVEQAPLLDDITTAYLGLGDTAEARNMQLERLDNALRRYGATDPRVIPFRYTLAKYYEQSRLPESAREQYEEVLKAQETRVGGSDASLLAPLRELVAIDLLVSQATDSTQRDRLASLLQQNGAAADPVERGLSLALLGDWATVAGDAETARNYYRQSWETLATLPNVDVARQFAKPAMIDFIAPLSPVDRGERRRPYTWAEIALEFDVSAEGLPSDVRVVTRDPRTTAIQSRYSRRMRETHFRPRLVDGEPVPTTNVRSTHYVRRYVNKSEEEEALEE